MEAISDLQLQIEELENRLTNLEGQAGVLIRFRATLDASRDQERCDAIDNRIADVISEVGTLRRALLELTGHEPEA